VLTVYNNEIVTARQDNLLVSSFHPELTEDYRLHQYFADMVKAKAAAIQ
jgi:5'-phosphate synthase pdxT subunit